MRSSFPLDLLPTTSLPTGYSVRPLNSGDYNRSHLNVLSVLTLAPDVGEAAWVAQFDALGQGSYYPIVIVEIASDQIVGTGTLFLERKFIRGLGLVGHIEDIAVSKDAQGRGFGKTIITVLTELSEKLGAYKVRLSSFLSQEDEFDIFDDVDYSGLRSEERR